MCNNCGGLLLIEPKRYNQLRGKAVKCKKCNHAVTIPSEHVDASKSEEAHALMPPLPLDDEELARMELAHDPSPVPRQSVNALTGVVHHPAADIENIRKILHGYGTPFAILKELIQNAEDAKSRNLYFRYVEPKPDCQHNLLTMPGLLVVNDGIFRREDSEAIPRMNLGTRGTDSRAIGRFGLGLKSVFLWCDALFISANLGTNETWLPNGNCIYEQFFNPWSGYKHKQWDAEWVNNMADKAILTEFIKEELIQSKFPSPDTWLAVWIPLRCKDAYHPSIRSEHPGSDKDFFEKLVGEFQKLAKSLCMLRNLDQIKLASSSKECVWSIKGDRINFFDFDENFNGSKRNITGELQVNACTVEYCGISGCLPYQDVNDIKNHPDWPRVNDIDARSEANSDIPSKGSPEYAAVLTCRKIETPNASGSVGVKWCVFLPIGEQPADSSSQVANRNTEKDSVLVPSFPYELTLNLNGFFFLDSERLRIDGLIDKFSTQDAKGQSVYLEWNRRIAYNGILPCLPRTIAEFAKGHDLNNSQCEALSGAIRRTWLWRNFGDDACCLQDYWVPRKHEDSTTTWEPCNAGQLALLIPPLKAKTVDSVPALMSFLKEHVVVESTNDGAPGLFGRHQIQRTSREHIRALLKNANISTDAVDTITWINDLLVFTGGDWTSDVAVTCLPLLKVCSVRTRQTSYISAVEWKQHQAANHLFSYDGQGWLPQILNILPDSADFYLADEAPAWFHYDLNDCDAEIAASILYEDESVCLDHKEEIIALCNKLLESTGNSPHVIKAIRFLLHGDRSKIDDLKAKLYIGNHSNIWSRVIALILEDEDQEWCLITDRLGIQKHLPYAEGYVFSADASVVLRKFTQRVGRISDLHFLEPDWTDDQVCDLMAEIYQEARRSHFAGDTQVNNILRRLRIHKLPNGNRVSIANDNGELNPEFVLDAEIKGASTLTGDLALRLRDIRQKAKVIARVNMQNAISIQEALFRAVDNNNHTHVVTLSWNYVVQKCLEAKCPGDYAELIMEALARVGSEAARGLGSVLKSTCWIPLTNRKGFVAPANVIYFRDVSTQYKPFEDAFCAAFPDGFQNEAGQLVCVPCQLGLNVPDHDGFGSLKGSMADTKGDAGLKLLADVLKDRSDLWLGVTTEACQSHVKDYSRFFNVLADHANRVPGVDIVRAIWTISHNQAWQPQVVQHLLPAVFKPFDSKHNPLFDLLKVFSQDTSHVEVFNAYLKQSVMDGLQEQLIHKTPEFRLLSMMGQWKRPNELIWPSDNLVTDCQLCQDQACILQHRKEERFDKIKNGEANIHAPNNVPDADHEAKKIRQYLASFSNAELGGVPCALVALLGQTPAMVELLKDLLHASGNRHNPDEFLKWLFGDQAHPALISSAKRVKFSFSVIRGQTAQATTIDDEEIIVRLIDHINTLYVGERSELWNYVRESALWHHLALREISNTDDPQALKIAFANTVCYVLRVAYAGGCDGYVPPDIDTRIQELAQTGRFDLLECQLRIKHNLLGLFEQLGVRDDMLIRSMIDNLNKIGDEELKANLAKRDPQNIEEWKGAVDSAFNKLITSDEPDAVDARRVMVAARQRQMEQFQYSASSVMFELFQNADDAVCELAALTSVLPESAFVFVVNAPSGSNHIDILHWGRPINYVPRADTRFFGFRRDLIKMLSINTSDKGREQQVANVTGKFGLGFKSVFFISQEPLVMSGGIAFKIRGGFYPVQLLEKEIGLLKDAAMTPKSEAIGQATPTVFRLPFPPPLSTHRDFDLEEDIIGAFQKHAEVMTIFARKINTIRINHNSYSSEKTDICTGMVNKHEVRQSIYLEFRCRWITPDNCEGTAQVLFRINDRGIEDFDDDIPGVWITSPTDETSAYRWLLNAPFAPDAGRRRVAASDGNSVIARRIAEKWKTALVQLFDKIEGAGYVLSGEFGFTPELNAYGFWEQLWDQVTRIADPVRDWCKVNNGSEILEWILWNSACGTYREFLRERAALPSKLQGCYNMLLPLGKVLYAPKGMLNKCFIGVASWQNVKNAYPPGEVVSESVAEFSARIGLISGISRFSLLDVLQKEIDDNLHVSPDSAECIAKLMGDFSDDFERLGKYAEEIAGIHVELFRKCKMKSASGGFEKIESMVCKATSTNRKYIEKDELLRAAFAPEACLLSADYQGEAISFFIEAREKLNANADVMKSWCENVTDVQKLNAIFEYICEGDLGQQLADRLERAWFENRRALAEKLMPNNMNELERKFKVRPVLLPPPPPPPQTKPIKDLLEWWNLELERDKNAVESYTFDGMWREFLGSNDTSSGLRDLLTHQQPGTDTITEMGRRAWFAIFSIASLLSMPKRTDSIYRFCKEHLNDLWNKTQGKDNFSTVAQHVFLSQVHQQSNGINAKGENADFWRRVFYDVRKIHHLIYHNDFIEVMLEVAKRGNANQLINFLRDGILTDQPRWSGVLGQTIKTSLLFVMRELSRLRVIDVDHRFCYFACKPVRQAAFGFGLIDERLRDALEFGRILEASEAIYSGYIAAGSVGTGLLPYFDIPLLHYAKTEVNYE